MIAEAMMRATIRGSDAPLSMLPELLPSEVGDGGRIGVTERKQVVKDMYSLGKENEPEEPGGSDLSGGVGDGVCDGLDGATDDIGDGIKVEVTTAGLGGAGGRVGGASLSNSAITASKVMTFWGFGLKTVTMWETVGSKLPRVKSESWGRSTKDQ